MVNIKIIDHTGHSEHNDLSLEQAEELIGEYKNYHVVDAETKRAIQDLSLLKEDQSVILVPIVAGG